MNKLLKIKLETLKKFQDKYPTAHVGGSIGLLLRNVNLSRDLSTSDLDITIDNFIFDIKDLPNFEHRSDGNDFDYSLKSNEQDGIYTKIDIRISPEPSFDKILFEGVYYNVSKYRDIIFWKTKYANKDSIKHVNDLYFIKNGHVNTPPIDSEICDLPF